MQHHSNEQFFSLLRYALGAASSFDARPTEAEWRYIYEQGVRQSVIALLFTAVNRLRDEQEPPLELTMKWATEAEDVRALNALLNSESKRLTDLFEVEGYHTAILKGQANARLYPDPMSRQPGDIDIFVNGGQERVGALLTRLGLIEEGEKPQGHHWHLHLPEEKPETEAHFLPLPLGRSTEKHTNCMHAFLQEEFKRGTVLCPEGFKVPSIPYALVMQLSHIWRHALHGGIGFRQMIDYYVLLTHSTPEERQLLRPMLKQFGLQQFASALMWILQQTLHLPADKMIAKPSRFRGQCLMKHTMHGGNFGQYDDNKKKAKEKKVNQKKKGIFRSIWDGRVQACRVMLSRPDLASSIFLSERALWIDIISNIPKLIKYRTIRLSKVRAIENKNA